MEVFPLISFFTGVISILSPCILPILPIFIGFSLKSKTKAEILSFTAGLFSIFTIIVFLTGFFTAIVYQYISYFRLISAVLLLIIGILMLFDYSFGFITVKSRNHDGILGSFALGFLTSVAWVPCYSAYLMSLISLLVSGIFIFSVTKLNPVAVYQSMFKGAYGTNRRMWVTIRDTMMLLCIALGLAPAFKMRFWNIGAEGQVLVGGLATVMVMMFLGEHLPLWLLLIVMVAASIIAESADADANIIFGVAFDEKLDDEMIVTVIATGFGTDSNGIANKSGAAVSSDAISSADEDDGDIVDILGLFKK